MKLRVLGCHGGVSRDHRSTSFLVDDRLALDAGSLARALSLSEQAAVEAVLVTHTHLDHVADLGPFADARLQQGGEPVLVAALPEVVAELREQYFGTSLWPDFTRIPAQAPVVRLVGLEADRPVDVVGCTVTPVPVDHGVPSAGFLIHHDGGTLAFSGDTGPTRRFWDAVSGTEDLVAVITEVSFPDRRVDLARISGHLTPGLLREELAKVDRSLDVPVCIYGMKPAFEEELRRALADLDPRLEVLEDDQVLHLG